jgi:hypothetical protein
MLLSRSYFARTWISQKIILAGSVTVQCDHEKLRWEDLRTAVACLKWKGWFKGATTRPDSDLAEMLTNKPA